MSKSLLFLDSSKNSLFSLLLYPQSLTLTTVVFPGTITFRVKI